MKKAKSNLEVNPRVSVIIPTYNRAQLVGRAIQSVLNQTYQDFELIVVDDCSTDNTAQIVKGIGDERVKYIPHQVNKGASAARNTGIRAARGELIGFLDSDDEWLPEKLQRQVDKFDSASANVGLVYGGYVVIDDETKRTIRQENPSKRGYVFRGILREDFVGSPTPLVKRECFEKVGLFDEEMQFGEDWDMWVRIAQHYEFDFLREMVANFYVSQHQITTDSIGVLQGFSKFWVKHQSHLSENPAVLAHHLKLVGQRYLIEREYTIARTYFAQAVRAKPRDMRLYIHLLAAFAVPSIYRAIWKTQFMLRFRKSFTLFYKLIRIR